MSQWWDSNRWSYWILIPSDSCRTKPPTTLRDRSALLGITPPHSGRSTPFGDPNGHRFADDLESQNDEQLEGLSAKVKLLKDVSERYFWKTAFFPRVWPAQITIGIGAEVRESAVQLSQMVRRYFFWWVQYWLDLTFRTMHSLKRLESLPERSEGWITWHHGKVVDGYGTSYF